MRTLPTDFPLCTYVGCDFCAGHRAECQGCSQIQPPRSGGQRSDDASLLLTGADTSAPGLESEDSEILTQINY